jgi:hypothetical protein
MRYIINKALRLPYRESRTDINRASVLLSHFTSTSLLPAFIMLQSTQTNCDGPEESGCRAEHSTISSTEPRTPLSDFSPVDRSALPLAYLVPSNNPARSAISKAREEGSTYHASFITEINHRGCSNTLCYELALGGLPGVSWSIGRGSNELDHKGVDFLLVTEDDSIASVHASFGWTTHKPDLLLIILNEQHKTCTINGCEFGYGHQKIPSKNTILIGDCAFTLLFIRRPWAAETLFQAELRNHVLRLLELERINDIEEPADTVSPKKDLKRSRSVDNIDDSQPILDHEDDYRPCKKFNYWD